jgi:hypothetical protein
MRCGIRWQRYTKSWTEMYRDVEVLREGDKLVTPARERVALRPVSPPDPAWLKAGELIVLLDGFQVVGVGRIVPKPVE